MIERGTAVRAQHEGQWYPATYVAARGDGTHRIVWGDGSGVDEVSVVEPIGEVAMPKMATPMPMKMARPKGPRPAAKQRVFTPDGGIAHYAQAYGHHIEHLDEMGIDHPKFSEHMEGAHRALAGIHHHLARATNHLSMLSGEPMQPPHPKTTMSPKMSAKRRS